MINNAEKPVIIFGNGSIDAPEEATKIIDASNTPCCTTLHAMGVISEHHPMSMHMMGIHNLEN